MPAGGKIKTWGELTAALKANPKAVSVAGGSAGGTDHLILGMLIKALGKNPREAAYVAFAGGGPANAAILGGQVSAGISGYSEFEEQIKAGRMIPLAVSGKRRIPGVNVPTLTELGINVTESNWRGVFAPPGISDAQREAMIDFVTKFEAKFGANTRNQFAGHSYDFQVALEKAVPLAMKKAKPGDIEQIKAARKAGQ